MAPLACPGAPRREPRPSRSEEIQAVNLCPGAPRREPRPTPRTDVSLVALPPANLFEVFGTSGHIKPQAPIGSPQRHGFNPTFQCTGRVLIFIEPEVQEPEVQEPEVQEVEGRVVLGEIHPNSCWTTPRQASTAYPQASTAYPQASTAYASIARGFTSAISFPPLASLPR